MREAAVNPRDKQNPTAVEAVLINIRTTFVQLQTDRHKADYDLTWRIVASDAMNAITLAEDIFFKWRSVRNEDAARHYLPTMFGANR